MPGAFVTGDELNDLPVAPHQKMGRHPDSPKLIEIGVCRMIQAIGEEALDGVPAVFIGWQTDAVNNQQFY